MYTRKHFKIVFVVILLHYPKYARGTKFVTEAHLLSIEIFFPGFLFVNFCSTTNKMPDYNIKKCTEKESCQRLIKGYLY